MSKWTPASGLLLLVEGSAGESSPVTLLLRYDLSPKLFSLEDDENAILAQSGARVLYIDQGYKGSYK